MLRKFAAHGMAILVAILIVFASQSECVAKTVAAMERGGCCKHGPCKPAPGQSTCQMAPASPEQGTVPAVASQGAIVVVECVVREVVLAVAGETPIQPHYTPPDRFVLNSSFLI